MARPKARLGPAATTRAGASRAARGKAIGLMLATLALAACGPASEASGAAGVAGPTAAIMPSEPSPSEPPLGSLPVGPTEAAHVVRIVDGDTIVVDRGRGPEKVRYIGMDTPETVDPDTPVEPFGEAATAANAALVAGADVVLERDVSDVDRYGRLLRYVWLRVTGPPSGWLMVDLELVREGYAQVATFPPDVRYVDLFVAAERAARDAGRGLWAGP